MAWRKGDRGAACRWLRKARQEAERALKYAKDDASRAPAESILTFLNRAGNEGVSVARQPAMGAVSRYEMPLEFSEEKPMLPSVRGVLQEVECGGERARLLLQAGQRQIGFVISKPDRVAIRNEPGSTM